MSLIKQTNIIKPVDYITFNTHKYFLNNLYHYYNR